MIPFAASSFGNGSTSGPPPPTDPNFSSTVLLLGMNGTAASTTFTDESAVARGNATAGGNAQVNTSLVKFGSGSLRLDGAGDNLSYADSADWLFSGDFTIEGWFLFDAANIGSVTQVLASQWEVPSDRSWILQLTSTALQFSISTNGTGAAGSPFPISSNWTPTADTFYHIAVDRSSSTWRLYRDGTMLAKITSSSTPFNSTKSLRVGASFSTTLGTVQQEMKGNVDELRITKGVARYASDAGYTVPTAAFPRS